MAARSAPSSSEVASAPARRELVIGLGCAAATAAIWTVFLLMSRAGARGTLTPFDLMALRFGVGGLVLLPVLLRMGLGGLSLRQIAVLATTAGPLFAIFAYLGFSLAPASHAAALMPGMLPFWTALLAWLLLGERVSGPRQVCLLVLLGGVAFLLLSGLREAPPGSWRGDLLFPLAPLCWSFYTIYARRWQVPALRASAVVAVFAGLCFVPIYAVALPKGLALTPWPELILQGFVQGVLGTAVALWVYTRAVVALGPAVTTMLTATVPGAAALLAVPFLGEALTPLAAVGIALVTAGMLGTVLSLRQTRAGSSARMPRKAS